MINLFVDIYSVSQKNPPAACGFLTFFDKWFRILNQSFTRLLYVPIYARLQIGSVISKFNKVMPD